MKLPLTLPFMTVTASVAPVRSGSVTAMPEKGAAVALSLTAWLADAPVIAGVSWVAVAAWEVVALAPPVWLALSVTVTLIETGAVLPGIMLWAVGVNVMLRSTVCSWAAVPLDVRARLITLEVCGTAG